MGLSSDLVSQFTKITNDSKRDATAVTLRGVIEKHDEIVYVKLDGSDELTPISRTVEVSEGDRVEVTIANHAATVTGNLSDPSIGVMRADGLESKIEQTAEAIRFELNNEVENMYTHVEITAAGIRSEMKATEESFDNALKDQGDSLKKQLEDEIDSLSKSIDDTSAALKAEIEGVVADFDEEINAANVKITEAETRVNESAAEYQRQMTAELKTINDNIQSNNDYIVKVEADYKQTAAGISNDLTTYIKNNDDTVATLRSEYNQTASELSNVITVTIPGINHEMTTMKSSINQNATSITTLVENDAEFSKFQQTVEGFSFMGKGGTVKISGGNINLTGCIMFSDFNKDTQQKINSIEAEANTALADSNDAFNKAVIAQNKADSAYDLADSIYVPTYITRTGITSTKIESPEIEGNNVTARTAFRIIPVGVDQDGNEVKVPCGYMGLAFGETLDESGTAQSTYGVAMASADTTVDSYGAITADSTGYYIIVTNEGVRLQAGDNSLYLIDSGAYYNGVLLGTGEGGIAVFG